MNLLSKRHGGLKAPDWTTCRTWFLKLGLFKLLRPKDTADDWVWIADHTVQLGSEKCLLITGARMKTLPRKRALQKNDLEPIALLPVKTSNGSVVFEQLQQAALLTGVPRAIVSDNGPDLKSGIELFLKEHKYTSHIYDIRHQVALLIKKELENDSAWKSFIEITSTAQSYMRQTEVASLAPPNQRSKARYMNVDILIKWALNVDRMTEEKKALFDKKELKRLLGWLDAYREDIERWGRLTHIAETVVSFIAINGVRRGNASELRSQLGAQTCEVSRVFKETLLNRVMENELKAHVGEYLVGSSDIIESTFGAFKNIEKHQASSGFTSLLLALPAMLGRTNEHIISQAMSEINSSKISEWFKSMVGLSVQAKRRIAFAA